MGCVIVAGTILVAVLWMVLLSLMVLLVVLCRSREWCNRWCSYCQRLVGGIAVGCCGGGIVTSHLKIEMIFSS